MQQLTQGPALLRKPRRKAKPSSLAKLSIVCCSVAIAPVKSEAVQHVQKRPGLPGFGRLAGVQERQHPFGPFPVVKAAEQVPQVALGDVLVIAQSE